MDNTKRQELLTTAISAALDAGKTVNDVYKGQDFEVEQKENETPLTLADRKSHQIIKSHLEQTAHPLLSEEGKDIAYKDRKDWEFFWLVDPLDGTKEFIKKNGEFTVNIALIYKGNPILGVVYAPYLGDLYFGEESFGAYKVENFNGIEDTFDNINDLMKEGTFLPISENRSKLIAVASRSHMNDDTQAYIDELKEKHGEVDFISKGSSLKICMVAEGKADVYPRFAPTMEWDTAAGHAVAISAGFQVSEKDEKTPLKYNKENLTNPWFIVKGKNV